MDDSELLLEDKGIDLLASKDLFLVDKDLVVKLAIEVVDTKEAVEVVQRLQIAEVVEGDGGENVAVDAVDAAEAID